MHPLHNTHATTHMLVTRIDSILSAFSRITFGGPPHLPSPGYKFQKSKYSDYSRLDSIPNKHCAMHEHLKRTVHTSILVVLTDLVVHCGSLLLLLLSSPLFLHGGMAPLDAWHAKQMMVYGKTKTVTRQKHETRVRSS